jgi:hypothetical protein
LFVIRILKPAGTVQPSATSNPSHKCERGGVWHFGLQSTEAWTRRNRHLEIPVPFRHGDCMSPWTGMIGSSLHKSCRNCRGGSVAPSRICPLPSVHQENSSPPIARPGIRQDSLSKPHADATVTLRMFCPYLAAIRSCANRPCCERERATSSVLRAYAGSVQRHASRFPTPEAQRLQPVRRSSHSHPYAGSSSHARRPNADAAAHITWLPVLLDWPRPNLASLTGDFSPIRSSGLDGRKLGKPRNFAARPRPRRNDGFSRRLRAAWPCPREAVHREVLCRDDEMMMI